MSVFKPIDPSDLRAFLTAACSLGLVASLGVIAQTPRRATAQLGLSGFVPADLLAYHRVQHATSIADALRNMRPVLPAHPPLTDQRAHHLGLPVSEIDWYRAAIALGDLLDRRTVLYSTMFFAGQDTADGPLLQPTWTARRSLDQLTEQHRTLHDLLGAY